MGYLDLVIEIVLSVGMAVGPSAAYIPQYFDIRRTRNHKAFSSVICFILLLSNIMRICCYLLEPFKITLLIQSFFMISVQLVLLHLIVKLHSRDILPVSSKSSTAEEAETIAEPPPVKRSYFAAFWAWPSFVEYLLFLVGFTACFLGLVLLDLHFAPKFIPRELFLYLSTGLESTLCMPQLWVNYRNQSTRGLNKTLVATWIAGDAYKLVYFVYTHSNMPFIVCAITQITVDVLIICQIFYYNRTCHPQREDAELSRPSSVVPLKQEDSIKASKIIVQNKK